LASSSDKFWAFDQLKVKAVWAFLGVLNPWILGNYPVANPNLAVIALQ
jgi:hypothetical protein